MQVTAIIQARMSSHRLPGKVLKTVQGKTMLSYLYERLVHCRSLDSIVISTSTDPSDDPVAAFCRSNRIVYFRGSLLDVAGRFKSTLDYLDCDAFVRVNGDSPLLDQGLVDQAVRLFRTASCDLVTNVFPRSFPAGQSVEVLKRTSFYRGYAQMMEPQDLEHVTPYFYRRNEEYKIINFSAARGYHGVNLAVDTKMDFEKFRFIVQHMQKPAWTYNLDEVVAIANIPERPADGCAA